MGSTTPMQGLRAEEAGHNHKPIRCWNEVPRVKLLLYLMHCDNDYGNLGWAEFVEEKEKKERRDQLKSIRAVIHHEMADTGDRPSSTLMNKMAKRLMSLTLAALLVDVGEPLSLAEEDGCLAMVEPTRPSMSMNALVYMLMFIIMVLIVMVTIISHKAYKFKQLSESTIRTW